MGPEDAGRWLATGDALSEAGEHAQAIGAYERSLKLDPASAETRYQLARAHYRLGEVQVAVGHLRASVATCSTIQPWLGLATILPGCPGSTPGEILDARKAFADRLKEFAPAARARPKAASQRRGRTRVGYVSGFFHKPHYMMPVWGLINHHDRAAFEVHLFADCEDDTFAGYDGHPADTVHHTAGLDAAELAALIDDTGVDLLIDLNGYSIPERLVLFLARRAAVTVAWFNMYATSGLPGIDYIFGDRWVVRPEEHRFFSERVCELSSSYLTFQPNRSTPPVAPSPYLSRDRFTFGCLASQYKLTDPVIDTWSRILRETPGAHLVLGNDALGSHHNCRHLRERFERRGLDSERLTLLGPADHQEFLRYYDQIDLALDPFPYSGGTTTMEAIWQGVPVLSCHGDRWAARTSASLLHSAGLGAYVCDDVEGFVGTAVTIATERRARAGLADLRLRLRSLVSASPVCDCAAAARAMEATYLRLFKGSGRSVHGERD